MNSSPEKITDTDREEILRLVLSEASGVEVEEALRRFPMGIRGKFRQVACEAGLVKGKLAKNGAGETRFASGSKLSERGVRRLTELNSRKAGS
jgi:hypothetical protein